MDAARLLNISEENFRSSLDRVSAIEVNSIDQNIFRPYAISREVARAIAENAESIGESNPFEQAQEAISELKNQMSSLNLSLPEFPVFENPLMPIMQDTPLTPTSLNLPSN